MLLVYKTYINIIINYNSVDILNIFHDNNNIYIYNLLAENFL